MHVLPTFASRSLFCQPLLLFPSFLLYVDSQPFYSSSPLFSSPLWQPLISFLSLFFVPPPLSKPAPDSLLALAIYSPKERRCPWHWRKKNRPYWRVACLALKQEASRRLGLWTLRMKRFCHAWGKSLDLLGEVQVGRMGKQTWDVTWCLCCQTCMGVSRASTVAGSLSKQQAGG